MTTKRPRKPADTPEEEAIRYVYDRLKELEGVVLSTSSLQLLWMAGDPDYEQRMGIRRRTSRKAGIEAAHKLGIAASGGSRLQ